MEEALEVILRPMLARRERRLTDPAVVAALEQALAGMSVRASYR